MQDVAAVQSSHIERASPPLTPIALPARWPLAVVVITLAHFACLIARDFWYPDEPDMAEITRQMVVRHDWLQLWLYQRPFDDYPPLFFWATSGFAMTLGQSEFVLRLPTALSASALMFAIGWWARRRFDERTALWSVVALGSTYLFFWQAINMHLDMLLAASVGTAIVTFDISTSAPSARERWSLRAVTALAMSAAALTKGPVGVVLPCGVLGLVALFDRDWRRIAVLTGIAAIAVAVFVSWAAAFAHRAGAESVVYFLTKQNVDRFLGGRSHMHGPQYYVINMWPDFLPWSLLLVPALVHGWREARRGHAGMKLALTWFAFGFVFFSAAASKRNVYYLPIAPAAAALIGSYIVALMTAANEPGALVRRLVTALAAVILVFGVAGFAGSYWIMHTFGARADILTVLGLVSLAFLCAGIALMRNARGARVKRAIALVPVTMIVGQIAIFGVLLPTFDDPLSAKPDARWLRERAGSESAPVGFFDARSDNLPKESSALSFYGSFAMEALTERDELRGFLEQHPPGVIVVAPNNLEALRERSGEELAVERELVVGSDRYLAVGVAR